MKNLYGSLIALSLNTLNNENIMENFRTIHSSKIENLITKFYYKKNHLCFQILLNCEGNETKLYKEFNDYAQYKAAYNKLLEMKKLDELILLEETAVNETHLSFS